jgi:hypothetical protein
VSPFGPPLVGLGRLHSVGIVTAGQRSAQPIPSKLARRGGVGRVVHTLHTQRAPRGDVDSAPAIGSRDIGSRASVATGPLAEYTESSSTCFARWEEHHFKIDLSRVLTNVRVASHEGTECMHIYLITLLLPSFLAQVAPYRRTLRGSRSTHRSKARILTLDQPSPPRSGKETNIPLDGSTTLFDGKDRASALSDSTSSSVRSTALKMSA